MSEQTAPIEGADEAVSEAPSAVEVDAEESVDEGAEEGSAPNRAGQLEQEGDIAGDYLEEFLDIVDADGDIDLDVEGDRAMVAVVGGDLDHLVGGDGEVLEALQELTRLAVYRETSERSRLMLDIGGFRARRREELVRLTEKVIAEAREGSEPVRMEPMSPFERKVVHDTVSAAGLVSESEGEEPDRRVVVRLA